jgi:hypothetical protein
MKSNLLFPFFLLAIAAFSACNSDQANDQAAGAPAEAAAPATKYKMTPFAQSADFPDASLMSMSYKDGKFSYVIGGSSYQLKAQTTDAPQKMCANSKDGQHIHLIVDTEPYVAKYDIEFEHEVPDGDHYILSFLSRSYHESLKKPGAAKAVKATVVSKAFTKTEDIKEPMLFYSRPKGNYIGKAETDKVMLDFYLLNCNLSPDGYKVKVSINNEWEQTVDAWQPYYIEGLPMGDNKIKLTLLDKDGNQVKTPLNPVERVFTLKEDPAPGQ